MCTDYIMHNAITSRHPVLSLFVACKIMRFSSKKKKIMRISQLVPVSAIHQQVQQHHLCTTISDHVSIGSIITLPHALHPTGWWSCFSYSMKCLKILPLTSHETWTLSASGSLHRHHIATSPTRDCGMGHSAPHWALVLCIFCWLVP